MNNYDFSTLNDKEFEEITKDLLNSEFNLGLRSFPRGRDQGIDLRSSSNKNKNSIVVQVKHYINSKYSLLKNKIVNEEVAKVKKIKPDRYLFVTSMKLTITQIDEIVELFKPFIKNANDVYSQIEINDLIGKNKNIEKKYYKLWLSSTSILQTIFNKAVDSRTRYFLEQLALKMRFYVPTNKINEGNEILKKEKILLITGEPGIGKTTLAEIILFTRAKKGYLVHKVEDVIEAESTISDDPNEKQIFYFDDFLGANYTEIINSHKTETRLTSFVERIYNSPNKYMVLTTRTVVLNYALSKYEKINKSKINTRHFELKLVDYSKYEKAVILYNHLYFKKVPIEKYNIILSNKFYFEIIQHRSYTPRIIEFITDESKIKNLNPNQYLQFILNNLENPKEIWSYSFQNQIQYFDRCFLFCLFTFGNSVLEETLIKSFISRLEYERKNHNQVIDSNQFDKSIKILLNGFVVSTIYNFNNSTSKYYSFINPSLIDYLINYIDNSISEKKSILNSIIFSIQLDRFNSKNEKFKFEKELQTIVRFKIENSHFLDLINVDNSTIFKSISILYDFCNDINVDDLILTKFKLIDFNEEWNYQQYLIAIEIIENIQPDNFPQLFLHIKKNFILICNSILSSMDYSSYAESILEYFEKFGYNYSEYSKSEEGKKSLEKYINNVLTSSEDDKKSSIEDDFENISEVEIIYHEIQEEKKELLSILRLDTTIQAKEFKIDKMYWEEKLDENIINKQIKEAESKLYEYEENVVKATKPVNENKKIEKLFNR